MKTVSLIAVVCLTGCVEDRSAPVVSTTTIPGTEIVVALNGPHRGGQFSYSVAIPHSPGIARSLGHFSPDQLTPATLDVIGDGVCRIQWGAGSQSPFVVIDVGNLVIVEDSNPANPRNVRMEIPSPSN